MLDDKGHLALHTAANLGYAETLRFLLSLPNVNIDQLTSVQRETALHLSCRKYDETTRFLIEAVRPLVVYSHRSISTYARFLHRAPPPPPSQRTVERHCIVQV